MSRRNLQESGDSLDLLLDTMCNLFGGIVFIALLVAMLAGDGARKRSEPPRSDTEDVLRRTISQLEAEKDNLFRSLAEKREDLSQLLGRVSTEKLEELGGLKSRHESLEADLESAEEDAALPPDAKAIQDRFNQERKRQEQVSLALDNEKRAFTREIARLKERGKALTAKSRQLADQRVRAVRLPREKEDPTRSNAYMIVRNGKTYPVYLKNTARYSRHVRMEPIPNGFLTQDDRIVPLPEAGLVLEQDLSDEFQGMNTSSSFPVFLVYPDSFEQFLVARRIAQDQGLDYGLKFLETNEPVILSVHGKKSGTQ